MSEVVRSEKRGEVVLLTLDRPKSLNALDAGMLEALGEAIGAVARDASARALVLTGEGRAFAAGADISKMQEMSPRDAEAYSRLGHSTFEALEALGVPTIAAVNGFALGGGCELCLACDWTYASTKAVFGQPEVGLGLIPGFGGTSRLLRRVGVAWAKELILGGENIDAETAQRIGLANRLFEPDALLEETLAAAAKIAGKGPVAVRAAKRVMQESQDADLRLANVLEINAFGLAFASEDRDEGIAAFLEKRDASFKGR